MIVWTRPAPSFVTMIRVCPTGTPEATRSSASSIFHKKLKIKKHPTKHCILNFIQDNITKKERENNLFYSNRMVFYIKTKQTKIIIISENHNYFLKTNKN